MMKHAIDIGLRSDDPTREVRAIRVRTDGHHSWTDDEIAQFERQHPIGSRARLVLALLLYTGQRRGDVIRMGAQHLHDGSLHIKQQKTDTELIIPVHPTLAAIIAASPREHLTFVTTRQGGPFEGSAFSRWFREQCDKAGLPHCSAHGLRKAAARRLAEAGCTAHEIGAITGHASLTELVRYTKAADQKRLAEAAMTKTRTSTGKLSQKFAKNGKKALQHQMLRINVMIGHHLLRISAALGRHPSEPRNVPNTRRNVPRRKSSTEKKMTKNNAAPSRENVSRSEPNLDSRYGEIGISAVAAALQFQSAVKNPAYAPAVHELDKWTAEMAA